MEKGIVGTMNEESISEVVELVLTEEGAKEFVLSRVFVNTL